MKKLTSIVLAISIFLLGIIMLSKAIVSWLESTFYSGDVVLILCGLMLILVSKAIIILERDGYYE
jgi:hypothetical protein